MDGKVGTIVAFVSIPGRVYEGERSEIFHNVPILLMMNRSVQIKILEKLD